MEAEPPSPYRKLLSVLISLVIGIGSLWPSACSSSPQKSPSPDWLAHRSQIPPYEAYHYRTEWLDTTGERYILTANRVQRLRKNDTLYWKLEGDICLLHLSINADTIEKLTCMEAHLYLEKGHFIAQQAVRLQSQEGITLETDYLVWEKASNRLLAPGWVRLQTPKETLRGEGMEYDLTTRTYKLRRTRGSVPSPLS
ncbi:MAG: LPS export ABC transporter periplasmic protein LptC [Bacteroidia bacterium]|nr:LPS export ABC transporter periplasmic protein LptC [Bacteroidia bacterium]